MKLAIEQLKIDEGFRGNVYKCTAGKNTIGYGRNLDDNPLTKQEAEMLLTNDLTRIGLQLARHAYYIDLSPVRKAVIVNMVFNLGLRKFTRFKNTIKALIEKDYEKASIEMLDSDWARQVGDRAIRLSDKMRLNE